MSKLKWTCTIIIIGLFITETGGGGLITYDKFGLNYDSLGYKGNWENALQSVYMRYEKDVPANPVTICAYYIQRMFQKEESFMTQPTHELHVTMFLKEGRGGTIAQTNFLFGPWRSWLQEKAYFSWMVLAQQWNWRKPDILRTNRVQDRGFSVKSFAELVTDVIGADLLGPVVGSGWFADRMRQMYYERYSCMHIFKILFETIELIETGASRDTTLIRQDKKILENMKAERQFNEKGEEIEDLGVWRLYEHWLDMPRGFIAYINYIGKAVSNYDDKYFADRPKKEQISHNFLAMHDLFFTATRQEWQSYEHARLKHEWFGNPIETERIRDKWHDKTKKILNFLIKYTPRSDTKIVLSAAEKFRELSLDPRTRLSNGTFYVFDPFPNYCDKYTGIQFDAPKVDVSRWKRISDKDGTKIAQLSTFLIFIISVFFFRKYFL